jgi:hypothetical protein
MRSLGVGGMLIPLVAVAVATTLLPIMLSQPHLQHRAARRTRS